MDANNQLIMQQNESDTIDVTACNRSTADRVECEACRVAGIIVLFTIELFAGYLNGLSLLMLSRYSLLEAPLTLYVFNMVLSDFLAVVTVYPLALVTLFYGSWEWWPPAQIWYQLAFPFFGIVTLNSMTAIAIDRFLTMTKSYSSYFLKKHGVRWVGGVWCISIIMMIPNFSTISSRTRTNESHCGRSTAKTVLVYPITFLFCSVLPPIVTTVICYGRIYSVVRVVANRIRISRISSASKTSNVSGTNDIENAKTEKILAKRMIIVVTFVLVSWLPYSFFEVIIEGFEISLPLSVRLLPALIAKSFAVVNPLINVIFNRKYKKKVVDYILCRCRRNNSVQPLRLQRMMLNTPFADELDFPFPKQQNGPLRVACTGNPFPILETISEHQESNMLRVAQFPMRAQIFGKAKLHFNAKLPSPLSHEERLPAEGCDDYKLTATKKPPLIRRKGVILMKGDSESFNSLNSLPSSKKI